MLTLIGKFIQALRCLLAADSIAPKDPRVLELAFRFQHLISQDSTPISPTAATIIKSEFTLLPAGDSPIAGLSEYLNSHKKDAKAVIAVTRARHFIGIESRTSEDDLIGILQSEKVTFEDAQEGLETMRLVGAQRINAYKELARKTWPEATVFAEDK